MIETIGRMGGHPGLSLDISLLRLDSGCRVFDGGGLAAFSSHPPFRSAETAPARIERHGILRRSACSGQGWHILTACRHSLLHVF
jgi:hypothetical protein